MGRNFTQLYLHCVWATWDRLPLITSDIRIPLYNAIANKCDLLNCHLIAIGGIPDHVHILTGFPPSLSISNFVKEVKGNSAHFINHKVKPESFFKWQGNYGAFTVSRSGINSVANYVRNQVLHHQSQSLIPEFEIMEDFDF